MEERRKHTTQTGAFTQPMLARLKTPDCRLARLNQNPYVLFTFMNTSLSKQRESGPFGRFMVWYKTNFLVQCTGLRHQPLAN